MRSIVLIGGHVVTPGGVLRSDLLIKGGYISRMEANVSGDVTVDCTGRCALPGFRDQHIHDINGLLRDLDDAERPGRVSRALASQGVTAYTPATLAAPTGKLIEYLRNIGRYARSRRNGSDGARLEGANIEGTFIRKECAQPYEYIVSPNMRLLSHIPSAYDLLASASSLFRREQLSFSFLLHFLVLISVYSWPGH